ncbi:hypothetical protein [Marinomonas colpomeniae]|uniref:Uncharacterized protein n=1 Tax=Marinomonas colpomeniae TaxID=2774408 RepID=A0ABR8NZE8_9GAMM|nr:hypothetical protein [Marinomonas colpomeniae]MBD5771425.1 hypothetical protein [Marinomonas colpomeniae]
MTNKSYLGSNMRCKKEPYQHPDSHIVCDMLSMCFDGSFANSTSRKRVRNTLDQQVFQTVSLLYRGLAERLLTSLGKLPQDTGTMNPEPGYIAIAYLSALNASDKYFSNRVMMVNWQVIKRIGRLVHKLDDRLFANMIIDYLARIQVVLDSTQNRRKAARLV